MSGVPTADGPGGPLVDPLGATDEGPAARETPVAAAEPSRSRRPSGTADNLWVWAGRVLGSSSFRLALLYVMLLSVSVAILLGFIYWSTAGYMDRQLDATIAAETQGLAEQYRRRGLRGLTSLIQERVARDPTGAGVYLLVDENLQPLVGNLDRWPGGFPDADGWVHFRLRERGPDRTEEHAARAQVFRLQGDLRLLVGRDVRDLEATRRLILDALTWGLALTAALALIGGWLMTGRVVRRIEAINQTSRDIMQGDLSRRIPLGGSGDDFDQLAEGLNRMLARIESLMAGVRQVSDNIAHDLRTPLTRLRTKLEVLRAELESALGEGHPTTTAVEETLADADVMLGTFNALLRIARIESRGRRAGFAEVDLVPLAQDVAELYEPVAAEKEQQLRVEVPSSAIVFGDRDLLFQAIGNLMDNAVKYTPAGGQVTLRVEPSRGAVEVQVADSGPGIPPPLREAVFRRFFRADHSRSTPGSGLGLSLVQAVIQLHGASITLGDNGPGLRVTVRLPRPQAAAQACGEPTETSSAPSTH